jgi:hypothetical protein
MYKGYRITKKQRGAASGERRTIVMKPFVIASSVALAVSLLSASAANAAFFIRPVLQYSGEFIDGYEPNGAKVGSQSFKDGFRSLYTQVNLREGTIKTFGSVTGPSSDFAIATGIFGERIRYTGPSDAPSTFQFNFDGSTYVDQVMLGEEPMFDPELVQPRFLGIDAYFAVYNAGDANYLNWTVFGSNAPKALYNDRIEFSTDEGSEVFFNETSNGFFTELNLVSGNSYDVYVAFNILLSAGPLVGPATMDFSNTATIGIAAPQGGSFTSSSGEFLGFAQTPSTGVVPEPASWAMLIAGFGLIGATLRRRRAALPLQTA